jgi:cytochrome d ubiquinol oxidase subunit II
MVELWFAIFWLMVTTYLVLDGRTLGMGAVRLFVAANPDERRQVLEAIGPMWSWYEVWLVPCTGGELVLPPVVSYDSAWGLGGPHACADSFVS